MSNQKRLAEIADIRQGRYLAPTQMFDSASEEAPIPVWGANGVLGYTEKPTYTYRVPLVTCRGNGCGLVQWPDEKSYISNNAMGIEPKTKTRSDSSYLYYSLLACDFSDVITGSAQPQITVSHLSSKAVTWVADESARSVVADILTGFDQKIDANRRINRTLEAMAQAIFKSWFVDFDPVKAKSAAKQEGRDPLRAAMSAISGKPDAELDAMQPEQYDQLAATAALFPYEMEESELGEIPKGWKANRINQFGDVICGKTPSKTNPEYFGGGIPFIKIPDMHNSVYVVSPLERLSASGVASQAKKTIPPGSICVSCIATVGKVVITHELSQTNQQINSIVPRLPQYTTYLYFQMKEKEKEFHDLASGGSATLNMNTSTFSKVGVLDPEFKVLEKFSALVAPLFSEILARQKQSTLLSETRDTLLPKLLSGELSVTEAAAEVGA
jgi:type I restriction enzyme S subunit